jgi:ABC-2 type transport system ATP-binding protein
VTTQPAAIEVVGLTKRFGGGVLAVDDLSFTVSPGRITGFLGPNGAGKTTTLRCLVGLVRPTAGTATIGGRPYHAIPRPNTVVGAALESSGFHPGRSARNHLRIRAAAIGAPPGRADDLLGFVGLADAKDQKAGQYSLGMRQRLALAMALVGEPSVLVLDEPANGLDPAGIAWLRTFLRHLAAQGATILVSSHLLAEVRQTVDDVVILDRGRLIRAGTLDNLVQGAHRVTVAGPDLASLRTTLADAGGTVTVNPDGSLSIADLTAAAIGHLAWQSHVELHQLTDQAPELESVFLSLTSERPTADLTAPTGPPMPGPDPEGGPADRLEHP